MATLTSRSVGSSYGELLKLNASSLSTSIAAVEDGLGVVSPLSLATNKIIVSSAATEGFNCNAPAFFSANAVFSSISLAALGTSETPIPEGFIGVLEVNPNGTLASGGSLNKVTLLNSTISSLAVDLTVANGGTGVSTFTSKGVLYGNAANALLATSAGTDGQVLVAGAAGVPSFVTRSPTLTVAGDATGTVTLTNLGDATLTLTIPAGQITDADITGPLSESKIPTLTETKIPNLTTAGKVSGSTITSGTIGGATSINTSGTITSGSFTSPGTIAGNAITSVTTIIATGNIQGAEGSFSSLKIRGTNRNYYFPTVDGNAGQVLATDGAGNIGWSAGGGGGGGLASVSADPTPTLGGNLNVASFKLVSAANGNIELEPNGTGTSVIKKVATPTVGTDAANKTYVDAQITSEAATAQYNATKIQGFSVDTTAPTAGQSLAYSTALAKYVPTTITSSGFFGFRMSGTHLLVDFGSGNFKKSDYRDNIFAPFVSVALNADGRLVATF